jgi:hypothetical protein
MFQCGASGRSLLASGRISGPDGTLLESGREWSPIVQTEPACVRTRATCLLVPNAARVRTRLMHRPDKDPTEAIYTPESPLSPPYPTKSHLWHFVSDCFWCFLSNFISTCLFVHSHPIPGIFLVSLFFILFILNC